jgi:hypothetical protein
MRKLFDDELDDMKQSVLVGESPNTQLGMILEKHEYIILQMYLEGKSGQILDLIATLCEAELHRMTSEVILWRE